MKKITMALLTLICVLTIQTPSSEAEWNYSFSDVQLENSHYSNILYLTEKRIIKGYEHTEYYDGESYTYYSFKPSNNVTNRQVATMLVRALNLGHVSYSNPGYKDVTTKDSAYKEIAIATKLGFFPESAYFNPGKPITREVMAYTLMKAFDLQGTTAVTFKDVSSSNKYHTAIQALAANNITTGNNGKFNPKDKLTRAQFASFLTRALVPETRPTNTVFSYNSGLVPTNFGSSYTYAEFYEGYSFDFTLDSVYNHSRFENTRTTIMDGSIEDAWARVEYYEDEDHFAISADMINASGTVVLPYPFKAGTSYKYFERQADYSAHHNFKVITTDGLYMVNNKLYKDVIIVTDKIFYDGSDSYLYASFVFAEDIGLLNMYTEMGEYDLVSIQD